MNTPQDIPPNEVFPLHWGLCSKNWEDLVIIVVLPELDTTPIESNYMDVSTQNIKRS